MRISLNLYSDKSRIYLRKVWEKFLILLIIISKKNVYKFKALTDKKIYFKIEMGSSYTFFTSLIFIRFNGGKTLIIISFIVLKISD